MAICVTGCSARMFCAAEICRWWPGYVSWKAVTSALPLGLVQPDAEHGRARPVLRRGLVAAAGRALHERGDRLHHHAGGGGMIEPARHHLARVADVLARERQQLVAAGEVVARVRIQPPAQLGDVAGAEYLAPRLRRAAQA